MSISGISGNLPLPGQAGLAPARTDIDGVLAQIRAMRSQSALDTSQLAGALDAPRTQTTTNASPGFTDHLKVALDSVNRLQKDAGAKAEAFAAGRSNDLVGTMLAMQKSDVAFQATMQVRNRLVSAYQDIMNMPI